jgi:hypothetical protein
LIIEGAATKQVKKLHDPAKRFANLFKKVLEGELLDGVCREHAAKTGSLERALAQSIPLLNDMSHHPG